MVTSEKTGRNKIVVIAVFVVGMMVGLAMFQAILIVTSPAGKQLSLDEAYNESINRSMTPDRGSVNDLTPIIYSNQDLIKQGTEDNWTVLVVTWTKFNSSYPVGQNVSTWWGETWVTVAPQLQDFFRNEVDKNTNLTLRAAQLLGLPPSNSNLYFVELYVHPADLFRPSLDNEINDTSASLTMPQNINATYKQWFDGNTISSYYPKKFPWTRLGYTYDWGNPGTSEGLSEFVVRKNATVMVRSVSPTTAYLDVWCAAS
jgi:hypothetical protein